MRRSFGQSPESDEPNIQQICDLDTHVGLGSLTKRAFSLRCFSFRALIRVNDLITRRDARVTIDGGEMGFDHLAEEVSDIPKGNNL